MLKSILLLLEGWGISCRDIPRWSDCFGGLWTAIPPIMHLDCPPQFCLTIVFHFSWVLQSSQEKLKTMLMQKFWGQSRCIMGDVEVALDRKLTLLVGYHLVLESERTLSYYQPLTNLNKRSENDNNCFHYLEKERLALASSMTSIVVLDFVTCYHGLAPWFIFCPISTTRICLANFNVYFLYIFYF